MIIDLHIHHVPEAFVRFVEKAAPYAVRRRPPRGESVKLEVGRLSYALNRTFFDPERLIARMQEMRVERAVLSLATPFVNYDVPASLGHETAELYNNEIAALCKVAPDRFRARRAVVRASLESAGARADGQIRARRCRRLSVRHDAEHLSHDLRRPV